MDVGQDPRQPDADVNAIIEQARRALERHETDEALRILDDAAREVPDHWEIPHLRGVLAARGKHWAEAEGYFQQAHRLNPLHPAPLTNLGNLRIEAEQYEEAVRFYEQALAVDPDYANAHHNLAVAYRRLGRLDESVRHLKRAQRLDAARPRGVESTPALPAGWLLLVGALAMVAFVWWTLFGQASP